MGLDDFKDDNGNGDSTDGTDSGSDSSDTNSSGTDETENGSGLDSFSTNDNRGGSTQNNGSDNQTNEVFGIPATKWSKMTKKERIAEVRDSKIHDFKPEEQLDERWSYDQMIAVNCVCGETITFLSSETCDKCDREYARRNRTVVKVHDPEGVRIHDNAKNN